MSGPKKLDEKPEYIRFRDNADQDFTAHNWNSGYLIIIHDAGCFFYREIFGDRYYIFGHYFIDSKL